MPITDRLTKRVGPLPLWGWGIVVVGGAAAGWFLFRPKGGRTSALSTALPAAASGRRAVPSGSGGGGGSDGALPFSGSAPSPVAGGGGTLLAAIPDALPGIGGDVSINVPSPTVPIDSLVAVVRPPVTAVAKAVAPQPAVLTDALARPQTPNFVLRALGLPTRGVATVGDSVRDIQQAGTNTAARRLPNPTNLRILGAEGVLFESPEDANRQAASGPGGFALDLEQSVIDGTFV